MSSLFERRGSDSPYIEAVWRGQAGSDYAPVCPASGHWHLLFLRQNERVKVSIEGPLTKATPVTQAEGTSWFGVTFPLGAFFPLCPSEISWMNRPFCRLPRKHPSGWLAPVGNFLTMKMSRRLLKSWCARVCWFPIQL